MPCLKVERELSGCFDELDDCGQLVADNGCDGKNNSLDTALDMLTYCRESCRNMYGNTSHLPEELQILGGVGDYVETVFGHRCV